jgi:glucosamine--fructose-6-phosphate aminotransferase (isomerizing)
MCGIIGITSNKLVSSPIINSLKKLEYRGYDSAGIATIDSGYIKEVKCEGRVESLEEAVSKSKLTGNVGIGHVRWATHGVPNTINAHPHSSENVSLVHNGIIENYNILKTMLIDNGYTFKSETDSEVVVNLLSHFYHKNGEDTTKAIQRTIDNLEGTWGLAILCKNEPNKLYATRHGSPILVGINDNEVIVFDVTITSLSFIPTKIGLPCLVAYNLFGSFLHKIANPQVPSKLSIVLCIAFVVSSPFL